MCETSNLSEIKGNTPCPPVPGMLTHGFPHWAEAVKPPGETHSYQTQNPLWIQNEGETLAGTWNVHKNITPTGELLEEKLSGFQAP